MQDNRKFIQVNLFQRLCLLKQTLPLVNVKATEHTSCFLHWVFCFLTPALIRFFIMVLFLSYINALINDFLLFIGALIPNVAGVIISYNPDNSRIFINISAYDTDLLLLRAAGRQIFLFTLGNRT